MIPSTAPSLFSFLALTGGISLTTIIYRSAMTTSRFSAVFVTAPNKDIASFLAKGLVSSRIAACVNIIPGVTSVYEWEGNLETDEEFLLMIKTEKEKVPEISDYVKKNHPYDVPEVIATPIEDGSSAYLDWIKDSLKKTPVEVSK